MFNNLRVKLKTLMKGSARNPETKFINPYAMSEPTTPQYDVKPEFKNGRFILKKKESMHDEKEKVESTVEEQKEKPDKVKKEPGLLKFVSDVVVADMKSLSRDERRKAKEIAQEEQAFKDYKAHRALQEKIIYDEFLKSREKRKKSDENIVRAEDAVVVIPPALELELLPSTESTVVSEPVVVSEPMVVMQPVRETTGNDITISTIKRTLDRWKTFNPKEAKK